MNKLQKSHIVVYCTMTLLFWFSNYAFVPYLSAYANTMTINTALIGLMLGAYGWAQLTLRIPIGIIADRYDNRRIFVRIGCVLTAVAAIGLFFAPNIYWLIICRALTGMSVSVWVTMSVLFSSYYTSENSVKALTLLNSCNFAGQMIASIIVIPIVARYGMRSSFLLAALVAVIPIFISMRLKEKPLQRKPIGFKELFRVGRTKWVLTISAMSVASQIMTFAAISGFTPQLALALGAKQSALAIIQLISTAGGTVFSLLASKVFTGRYGARNSVIALLALQAVTTIVQPLMPSLLALYIIVAINGISRGTSMSVMLGLVILPFPYKKQSAAMGFYQAAYSLGIIFGPTIAGMVMSKSGIALAFYVIGAIGLIAPLIGLGLLPDERKTIPQYE